MVNLTTTMKRGERKAPKHISLDEDMTVSALLHKWLIECQAKDSGSTEGKMIMKRVHD